MNWYVLVDLCEGHAQEVILSEELAVAIRAIGEPIILDGPYANREEARCSANDWRYDFACQERWLEQAGGAA